jgi:hypothetical protein
MRSIYVYRRRRFTSEKLWYKDVGTSSKGPKKKLLPEKYRRLFANKQIVCIEYQDITDDDEREIFQVRLMVHLTLNLFELNIYRRGSNLAWP